MSEVDLHSRQIRHNRNQERNKGTPVGTGDVIAITSMCTIQSWNINMLPLHNPIIRTHDGSNGSQEDTETGHETEE